MVNPKTEIYKGYKIYFYKNPQGVVMFAGTDNKKIDQKLRDYIYLNSSYVYTKTGLMKLIKKYINKL